MRAIGYVRVSTERQADGLGLDIQEDAIRDTSRERGFRLERIVRDEGVSGALEDRPGIAALLSALTSGMVVVVPRLDRLARDLIVQEVLLRDIRDRAADVVSCAPGENDYLREDDGDPTRRLIRQVLGAVSEFERALVRLRLQRGRAAKAARGGYAYGSPPFGWRAAGGELVPDADEQRTLARIADLWEGGYSFRQMAQVLTDEGHTPKRGHRWHPESLRLIIRRQRWGEAS